jgi:dynein heavy chain 1
VRTDLKELEEMCLGERKWTNDLQRISEQIKLDQIPTKWRKYNVMDITTAEWIQDFAKRIEQMQKLKSEEEFGKNGIWFGGLLYPEAYLTATRQYLAHQN